MLFLLSIGPWIFFFLIFIKSSVGGIRESFLATCVLWGTVLTVIVELLSLAGAVNTVGIAVAWGCVAVVTGGIMFLIRKAHSPPLKPSGFDRTSIILLGAISTIVLVTGVTALVAPPNNWDSMTYHLPRVMHWIQNEAVAHYPTNIPRQLYNPPWAEFSILSGLLLSDNDYFANLVQWVAMVGTLIGVSLIARELGADLRGQICAAAFCAAIPMGVLQASSTQNDYVVSFWLVSFLYFGLQSVKEPDWKMTVLTGLSLGLAALTKGVSYVYAAPFILWLILVWVGSFPKQLLRHFAVVLLIFGFLNWGHYYRNWSLYGNPLSTDTTVLTNEVVSLKAFISNASRNTASHFVTSSDVMNNLLGNWVYSFHLFIDSDIHDPRTTFGQGFGIEPRVFHEDYAANWIHAILIPVSLVLVLSCKKLRASRTIVAYSTALVLVGILYCLCFKWQIWGSRLQLPIFVLWSPVLAVAFSAISSRLASALSATLLILAALWSVQNETRPVMGSLSIFSADRAAMYFTSNPSMRPFVQSAANQVVLSGCTNVGLKVTEDGYEYPLWVILKHKFPEMPRIEHVDITNRSRTIPLKSFDSPCVLKML